MFSVSTGSTAAVPSTQFRLGWFDALSNLNNPAGIAADGMSMITAYYGNSAQPGKYLNAAAAAGVTVFAELPRNLVKAMDIERIKAYVTLFKDKPALEGWYLADEPTLNAEIGPLTPQNATTIYNAIKSVDPVHPVSITFASGEDPTPFLPALDILQHDHYPFKAGTPEFGNLDTWKRFTFEMSTVAFFNNKPFFPVLQAFGGTDSAPVLGYRAPISNEMRYMVFSSIAALADSLYFWNYYRRDPNWVSTTLAPIVAELRPMLPALTAGFRSGVVSSSNPAISATAFQDPASGRWYVVAVNHSADPAAAGSLTFSGALSGKTMAFYGQGTPAPIVLDNLAHVLGPYEARVYWID
jgi:hypothetical protein